MPDAQPKPTAAEVGWCEACKFGACTECRSYDCTHDCTKGADHA